MQANWSLILNVLLLAGVIAAIWSLVRTRRQTFRTRSSEQPVLGAVDVRQFDDIIAVRKINPDVQETENDAEPEAMVNLARMPLRPEPPEEIRPQGHTFSRAQPTKSIMLFLQARENRQLAGYELLQTVLAAGLRFGEGQLFHRHQHANGQGPVLCSLATATASGVFDLQNIGGFSVRGLCMFMHASGNTTIDSERLDIMLDTARQLAEGLDTYLLDDLKKPLNDDSVLRYQRLLNVTAADAEAP